MDHRDFTLYIDPNGSTFSDEYKLFAQESDTWYMIDGRTWKTKLGVFSDVSHLESTHIPEEGLSKEGHWKKLYFAGKSTLFSYIPISWLDRRLQVAPFFGDSHSKYFKRTCVHVYTSYDKICQSCLDEILADTEAKWVDKVPDAFVLDIFSDGHAAYPKNTVQSEVKISGGKK